MNLEKQVDAAHLLIRHHLKPDDLAIDATCGNGQDTLFMATLLPEGKIYALDIQPAALARTQEKLRQAGLEGRVELFHQSHETFPEAIQRGSVKLIVYNLGYLPGGDRKLTTMTQTTMQSLNAALPLLKEDGALSIMLYPGHAEGTKEAEIVAEWAKNLPSYAYVVQKMTRLNRNLAPELLWIQGIPRLSGSKE
jgi:tRNA1(Val) A37 N6-methylase TrmN6